MGDEATEYLREIRDILVKVESDLAKVKAIAENAAEAAQDGESVRVNNCYECASFASESKWCNFHGGQVPNDFVLKGCEHFREYIPF